MKNVMSVRVDPECLRHVRDLARRGKKDLSGAARDLMEYGWQYYMLKEYRAGRVSLGNLARKLDVSLSETIDLLSDLGVRSPIEYDDYLKAYAEARDLFGK